MGTHIRMNPTPYIVKKDREGTVRIYHRKLRVAVAEFYHHSAGDALAIKAILDGKEEGGLLPAEPPPEKAKARGTLEEVIEYFATIKLPESDARYMFNKWESTGWLNGKAKIKDWKATARSWQSAGYMPSQKQTNGNPYNSRPSGGFNQPGRYTSGAAPQ